MSNVDDMFFTSASGVSWYVNLLGGEKSRGTWRMPDDMRVAGPVGGANLAGDHVADRAAVNHVVVACCGA
jgi:hypothetical protein